MINEKIKNKPIKKETRGKPYPSGDKWCITLDRGIKPNGKRDRPTKRFNSLEEAERDGLLYDMGMPCKLNKYLGHLIFLLYAQMMM